MLKTTLLFFCGFLILSYSAYGWVGRVLPVSFNEDTQEWSMLLGYDKNDKKWIDFRGCSKDEKDINYTFVALQSLKKNTNGDYGDSVDTLFFLENISKYGTKNFFHISKVASYISGQNLYKKAENKFGNNAIIDFKWISLNEALNNQNVNHKKGGKIDDYLYWFIKNYVAKELKEKSSKKEEIVISKNSWPRQGDKNAVHFYHSNQPYYEFANTYAVNIDLDGHTWKSAEHYFQAGKFNDPWLAYNTGINGQQALKNIRLGELQKTLRNYSGKINDEAWKKISFSRMLKALWAKFTQNTSLQQMLLNTRNKIIIEDAGDTDSFYGAGGDYKGKNHLGQMLMQVRDLMLFYEDNKKKIPKNLTENFKYQSYAPEEYIKAYKADTLMSAVPKKKQKNGNAITTFAQALKSIA